MDRNDNTSETRSYEAPAVESEEVFETLALTCTKADQQCLPGTGDLVGRS